MARLRRIERARERLLRRVDEMDDDLLETRPQPGKWSIREIVEHLVLAEESVMGDPSGLERLEALRRTVRGRILYAVVLVVLRFDIPVEAPAREMIPTGEGSIDALADRWRQNHRRLRAYLEGLQAGDRERAIFRHPVCGPMMPSQAVLMLEIHLARHIRQIDAIERARGSVG